MKTNKYYIQTASVHDREKLVAEIWDDDVILAEINNEGQRSSLEINANNDKLALGYEEFLEAIHKAKAKPE